MAVSMLMVIVSAPMAVSGEITPYKGWAGADSPLYGIRLSLQEPDERLSSASTLNKLVYHAVERLAEAKATAITMVKN